MIWFQGCLSLNAKCADRNLPDKYESLGDHIEDVAGLPKSINLSILWAESLAESNAVSSHGELIIATQCRDNYEHKGPYRSYRTQDDAYP